MGSLLIELKIGRPGLFDDYAAMRAARNLARDYRKMGQPDLAATHSRRALRIQSDLIAAMLNGTDLAADQARDILDGGDDDE